MNKSLLATVFTLISTLLFPWISQAATFYTGIVDNGTTNAVSLGLAHPDIGSDSTGAMHACYYDSVNFDLKYSTNFSGKWVSATVDSSLKVGTYCSIAVDSNDKVHISYYDATNYDLKYATNSSGSWAVTTVDSGGTVGTYTSIAVDSNDYAHISYYDATNYDLKYTTNSSGTWVATTVDSSGRVGSYAAIAVDSSDNVHISYYDSTNSDLKYVTNESGTWATTTVDSDGNNGTQTDIALDSSGFVHISYISGASIMHADNLSGSWETDLIGSGSSTYITKIALASDDTIYISYYNSSSMLYYASASNATTTVPSVDAYGVVVGSETGHSWTVNSGNVAGTVKYPVMTLDSSDNPFFLYHDSKCMDLKFASLDSQWNIGAYDSYGSGSYTDGKAGSYSSLSINGDYAYVSYYDAINRELALAKGTMGSDNQPPSTWTRTTIDTVPSTVGYWTSIATFDSYNYYIAYQDVTNKDAEFYSGIVTETITYDAYGVPSTTDTTTSVQETIESTNSQGSYSQIAIDSNGYSHVVYFDATNLDLKYATNESGAWITEIVDGSITSVGMYMDIVVDDDDFVHISYYNLTGGGKLKYATNESGAWQTEIVDSSGVTGQWNGIDVDSTGVVHISYYYFSSADLKYATGNYGSWTKSTIDTTGDVGKYSSLVVDENDQVHISYYDATNTDLKYATDSDGDGVFETETVDASSNDVGKYSSIDMYGTTPVITYYDASAQDLRIAVSP